MGITLFVAKDFIWIDRIYNMFVLPGQCFMVEDASTLPMPVDNSGVLTWEFYYTAVVL